VQSVILFLLTCAVCARGVWFAEQTRRAIQAICEKPLASNRRLAELRHDLAPAKRLIPSGATVHYAPQPSRSFAVRDTTFQLMISAMAPCHLVHLPSAEFVLADFDSAEQLQAIEDLRGAEVLLAIRPGMALLRRPPR
jgi:hypothetical protein